MESIKRSLSLQLVVMIVSPLALLLTLVAGYLVHNESERTRTNIDNDIEALVTLKSTEISNYFVAKGQIIHTLFSQPELVEWIDNYRDRGSDISQDAKYQKTVQYFSYLTDHDVDIKAVFFGSAHTFEYFDTSGRYDGDPNYYTNKRPWWQQAIDKGGLFVGEPAVDANDGSISSTVKTLIKNKQGDLIGIGGMDILVDTIGKNLLASIKYQNQGQAFLVTDQGKLVFFKDFNASLPPSSMLAKVDNSFSQTQGFSKLQSQILSNTQGVAEVTYKGVPQRVTFMSVKGDYPKQHWHLAFMLPTAVIEAPVSQAVWNATLISLAIIALVGFMVWGMLQPFRQQLNKLVQSMEDIAQGDGDLSRRIELDRQDQLGRLSRAFNLFAEKVQNMLKGTLEQTQKVNQGVEEIRAEYEQALDNVTEQKRQIDSVATAASEMAHTSQDMANSAKRSSEFADNAHHQAEEGGEIVSLAAKGLYDMSQQVIEASDVVRELRDSSEQIGEVLSVIRGIAEQTNLLALNAAIEAARAGEQGRGFAVVADEVRTLASRTQDSTANIQTIIATLQQSAHKAESVMQECVDQAKTGENLTSQVEKTLTGITEAVSAIKAQTTDITVAVSQQAVTAEDVAVNAEQVRELSEESLKSNQQLNQTIQLFEEATQDLNQNIGQFKI
ncbi:methyl-accepting chemotaxis protein [Parashewanella tropica]|uniref:methyl-accepting chemotaxis protein n=1 Tax=Parashewanella tropica TaxID=2547970 RepID=UPI0010595511|nr:methyl-accepting chemotaxis protein [Parashewanella tropica]